MALFCFERWSPGRWAVSFFSIWSSISRASPISQIDQSGTTNYHYVFLQELEGHSVERIPLSRKARSTRTYRAQNIFEICCISFLVPSLNGEESLKKLNNTRIQIQIFTKIESILPRHTPNLCSKVRLNPSTAFWDIVVYIVFGLSLNGEELL